MNTKDERDEVGARPTLQFDETVSGDSTVERFRAENLKEAAVQSLRDRRQR